MQNRSKPMKTLFMFLLLPASLVLFAQNTNLKLAQDPAAEPYLDKLSSLFSGSKPYQIQFRYEIHSLIDKTKTIQQGNIILKGNKYKITLPDNELIYNGLKLWSFNRVNQEVYISEPDPENSDQMLAAPFKMIASYKAHYKYRLKGEKSIDGIIYKDIELYPEEANGEYSMLKILYDPALNKPYSLSLKQKNGYEIVVFIKEIKLNPEAPDTLFEWISADHPGVLEIEM